MASKKKFLSVRFLLSAAAALLALVAIFLMFAPAAVCELIPETPLTKAQTVNYTGIQLTFGYTEITTVPVIGTEVKTEIFKFSFANFLPYILLAAGIAFSVLTAFGKLGKISPIVAAACLVVAGVLFFLAPDMCVPASDNKELVKNLKDSLSLASGAIVAGVLSVIAALLALVPLFLKKGKR
ncbi:MAG: hypothetical protein HFK02_05075 [Clostridia bacterium]|nr:hypothetical protein [Clostridia bacterium]